MLNIGVFIYGYNCVTSFHYVYRQVENKSKKRLDKITIRTMILLFCIYLPIGIVAYLSFGTTLQQPGAALFPNRPPIPGQTDYLMEIGRVCMIPTCWVVSMINGFAFKDQTYDLFKIKRTFWGRTGVTMLSTFGAAFVGWCYPNVTEWFSLLGAFSGAFLNCYFPAMLFLHQFKAGYKRKWVKPFTWVWMIINMVILLGCAVCVAINIIITIVNGGEIAASG